MIETLEFDQEADVLDVIFGEKRPAWTIELTSNILISIDQRSEELVRLTFLDYSELVTPTVLGTRSFPVVGLAQLPLIERNRVARVLQTPEAKRWLDVSTVENLPDSPFMVAHLQPPPVKLATTLFAVP